MAEEDTKHGGQEQRGQRVARQLSLWGVPVIVAVIALLYSIYGEKVFLWVSIFVTLGIAVGLAYYWSSSIARLLASLAMLQFLGCGFAIPADGGDWLVATYFGVDIYLFARLYLFYKIVRKPEPQLSWEMKVAMMTSPVWMAVVVTYLMETYGFFR